MDKTCDPKDYDAACEDFMITVTDAHVLVCAMELSEMESLTDIPSKKFFPDGSSELLDSVQQRNILLLAAEQLVEKYVDLSISEEKPKKEKKKQKPKRKMHSDPTGHRKTVDVMVMATNEAVPDSRLAENCYCTAPLWVSLRMSSSTI